MNYHYQVTTFRAKQLQKLRNVTMHSPTLIQVLSGSKRLYWKEDAVALTHQRFLLCPASSSLSFENMPEKGPFLSRVFSFHHLPTESMMQLSYEHQGSSDSPLLKHNKALLASLDALTSFDLSTMSSETQILWLMPLYQQLAEKGALQLLFPSQEASLSHKLSRYLALSPGESHPLEEVADKFAMSRATLIRKLKQEGLQYRELLAEVRLNHALHLMQSTPWSTLNLAQMCGYQSEERFSQRFKNKFGITPKEYMKTVTG
ncbi:helix-turn-helix transcriptional regulator [Vibrio sp. NH-7]